MTETIHHINKWWGINGGLKLYRLDLGMANGVALIQATLPLYHPNSGKNVPQAVSSTCSFGTQVPSTLARVSMLLLSYQ